MKTSSPSSRYTALLFVLLCYLVPVMALSISTDILTHWEVMSIGLCITALGSLAIFCAMVKARPVSPLPLLDRVESPLHSDESNDEPSLQPLLQQSQRELQLAHVENGRLASDIEVLMGNIKQLQLEKEDALGQVQSNLIEWQSYREQVLLQMEQQQAKILSLQETLADRQMSYDKKLQQIGHLEEKVGDLTGELKTLLHRAESHSGYISKDQSAHSIKEHQSPSYSLAPAVEGGQEDFLTLPIEKQVHTQEEASLQLKRCIDIAQKIMGSQRFLSPSNAFRDYPADGFALDLRRLCDSLRSENNSAILLYSPKENQLLFANNQIRGLTGWSPDKFLQNFTDIICDKEGWKQGVSSLALRSEVNTQLTLKLKSGQEAIVNGHFGMIPTGVFKNHVISVLYTSIK